MTNRQLCRLLKNAIDDEGKACGKEYNEMINVYKHLHPANSEEKRKFRAESEAVEEVRNQECEHLALMKVLHRRHC